MGCCGSKEDALEAEKQRAQQEAAARAAAERAAAERAAAEAAQRAAAAAAAAARPRTPPGPSPEELRRRAEQAAREEEEWRNRNLDVAAGKGSVVDQGISIAALLELVQSDAQLEGLSPQEWAARSIAPATAAKKCRFVDTLRPEAVVRPSYFCLLAPSWHRPMAEVVKIVWEHIQDMEPGLSPSSVGVWLSCCAVNPHNPAHHVAADMAAVDRALRDALPTLVCMEQAGAAQPAAGTSTADPLPPNLPAQVGGSHVPALTLYRAREGLRGFQGAMFNTVRISYL